MRESAIETHFAARVKETGGQVRKLTFPGRRGAPDRLAGWPASILRPALHILVELKAPRGKLKAHQVREHNRLRQIGFDVYTLWTIDEIETLLAKLGL